MGLFPVLSVITSYSIHYTKLYEEFYISPNPGEEAKPLAWIASGGELSRIMLALKSVAPEGDGVSTVVFDEVDAGVGGMAATAVGKKLLGVAQGLQVLCITHLPHRITSYNVCYTKLLRD